MPHRLPLPSASLARQGSSWRCVWGRYVGMLPCGPVSEGRGSCSASVCHSTCWHSWFPQWTVAPQSQHPCRPRPWHSHHHAWLQARHTCLCTPHLAHSSLVCLSLANCLQAFLCIIFRRGFFLGWQPCRPIWCSVRRIVWALTGWPPTPSASAAMLAALIRLFPKHNLWIWRWARALNFFGRPWRGLFWVEPVLLNRCMVLATVLQLSFRVLQSSYSLCHLYVEQQ